MTRKRGGGMASNVGVDPGEIPSPAAAGDAAPGPASAQPWPSKRTSSYTPCTLTVVVMFTVLDRQVLSLMIEPVKQDFGISDTQVSLLLGAAFSITYGIAGIPIAMI